MIDEQTIKRITKSILQLIIACILIYLCLSHINHIVQAIAWLLDMIKPLFIGIFIALMLNIPMTFIENKINKYRLKLRRSISIFASLTIVFGLIVLLNVIVLPELIQSITLIMNSLDQISKIDVSNMNELPIIYQFIKNIDLSSIILKLQEWINSQSSYFIEQGMHTIKNITGELVSVFMGLVFSIYILSSKETLKKQLIRLMNVWLPKQMNDTIFYISNVASHTFQQYIIGQMTEAIILGILCFIGMIILQIPYALVISTLVGFTALIPYIGGMIGCAVGFIVIFIVNPFQAFIFVVYLFVLQQVEGNFIYPQIVGKRINLPPIWVFASITLGGSFAGPLGMFVSVPLVTTIFKIVKKATKDREKKICEVREL